MDHNLGLTDEQDIKKYIERDLTKRTSKVDSIPYQIVRDEVVGRYEYHNNTRIRFLMKKALVPFNYKYYNWFILGTW